MHLSNGAAVRLRFFACVVSILWIAAVASAAPTKPTLQSIAVTPANTTLPVGTTQQYTAIGTYSDGSTQNLTKSATWSASSSAISVSKSGSATAQAIAGSVTITASSGAITGTASASVTQAALASIAVSPAKASVAAGTTQQFTATGTYTDGSTQPLTTSVAWTATAGASINSAGLATGVTAGTTSTIMATLNSISGSASLKVTSPSLVSIAVTPANPSLLMPNTVQFVATGTYTDGSTQDLTASSTWASSNTAAASISTSGVTSGVAAGSTTISAVKASITGSTGLTVTAPAPVFNSTAPSSASEGMLYTYNISASDPLGGSVSFSIVTAPGSASISGSILSWTPSSAESRVSDSFAILVTTSEGGTATQNYSVTPNGTIYISGIDTYITESGTVTQPQDLSAVTFNLYFNDGLGNWTTYTGSGTTAGAYTIPNVPAGSYFLARGVAPAAPRVVASSSSNIDWGSDNLGRPNAIAASAGTTIDLSLGSMSPWQTTDDLELWVPNNLAGLTNFDCAGCYPYALPSVGATSYSDSINSHNLALPLIDSTQGDNLYVLHLGSVSQGGYTWSVLQDVFGPQGGITQADGASTPVSGNFALPAQNASFYAAANAPSFASAIAGAGSAPSFQPTTMGVFIQPPGSYTGFIGVNPGLAGMDAKNGTVLSGNIDAGAMSYADPFPAQWIRYFQYSQIANQGVTAPGATRPGAFPLNATLVTTTMPSQAAPAMNNVSAVSGITISGMSAANPLSGVGTGPTFAWQAPSGAQNTLNYQVRILKLGVNANGKTTLTVVAFISTTSTSLQLPPGALDAGSTYVARIAAFDMPVDRSVAPVRYALPMAISMAATNTFTP